MKDSLFVHKMLSNWVFIYFILFYTLKLKFNPIFLFIFIILFFYSFAFILFFYDLYIFGFLVAMVGVFTKLIPAYLCLHRKINFAADFYFAVLFIISYFLVLYLLNTNVFYVYTTTIERLLTIPITIKNIPYFFLVAVGIL